MDPRPLMPRPVPPEFREGMELEWPLVALEPFLFIANAALDRLVETAGDRRIRLTRPGVHVTLDPDG